MTRLHSPVSAAQVQSVAQRYFVEDQLTSGVLVRRGNNISVTFNEAVQGVTGTTFNVRSDPSRNTFEVTVVEVRGKSIKLGFTFPPEVSVLRREIHERIKEENRAAAAAGTSDIELGTDGLPGLAPGQDKAQDKTDS